MMRRLPSVSSSSQLPRLPRLANVLLVAGLAGFLAACMEDGSEDTVDDDDPTVGMVVAISDRAEPDGSDFETDTVAEASLGAVGCMLYDDGKMQGTQREMSANSSVALVDRRVSSVIVAPNCQLTLKDSSGNGRKFSGGSNASYVWYVGDDWNDRATSATCVCTGTPNLGGRIYEDANYAGNHLPVWRNTTLSIGDFWNDRVTALKAQDGTTLALAEHANGDGRYYVTIGGSSANVGSGYNDLASRVTSDEMDWDECPVSGRCYETSRTCGGTYRLELNIRTCFRAGANQGQSYCKATQSGNRCVPRWAVAA